MSDNETAAMSKVRNILRNYGMEWPDDEWVEDLALELVAATRTAALEEAAGIAEQRNRVPVGASTDGPVAYHSAAIFPTDGYRIATAIRAAKEETK